MTPKLRVLIFVAPACILLDQLTKTLVIDKIQYGDRIPVIDGFFYLSHVRNTGAAFGILADAPEPLRFWFFMGVSAVAVAILISFFRKLAPGDRFSALSLGLILGGAIGNLIDRIRLGEVVDFLHFKLWRGYSWPDFNVADSCIVVGVAFLMVELLAHEGETRAADPDGGTGS